MLLSKRSKQLGAVTNNKHTRVVAWGSWWEEQSGQVGNCRVRLQQVLKGKSKRTWTHSTMPVLANLTRLRRMVEVPAREKKSEKCRMLKICEYTSNEIRPDIACTHHRYAVRNYVKEI